MKGIWTLLKNAGSEFMVDKAPRLGAALAYYTIFALAPLLVIAIGIAGLVFGRTATEHHVATEVQQLMGPQAGKTIQSMIESASKPESGVLGTVLGIIMLVFGATGLFGQLQDALNTIWEVEPKSGGGIWGWIRERFLSLSMVLGVAFLLLVSLLISAALSSLATLFGEWQTSVLGQVVTSIIDLVVITLLFAMIFRYLPDAKIAWRDVWLGAFITAVLFIIGKSLIGLYLGHSGVGSAYGAAGSLAVLLVWLYYSSQIFLFGAEFTKAYANQYGSRIVPDENAVPVTEHTRAEQGIPRNGRQTSQTPARK